MRVGSAGILLQYYSPLKVAENFRTLEAMFPGRIDLGVTRAGPAQREIQAALLERDPLSNPFRDYGEKVATSICS